MSDGTSSTHLLLGGLALFLVVAAVALLWAYGCCDKNKQFKWNACKTDDWTPFAAFKDCKGKAGQGGQGKTGGKGGKGKNCDCYRWNNTLYQGPAPTCPLQPTTCGKKEESCTLCPASCNLKTDDVKDPGKSLDCDKQAKKTKKK